MALVIEDGTMPVNANSYVTVGDCDKWQLARGSEDWPAAPEIEDDSNQAAKEAALIKACDYLNGLPWKGRRAAAGRVLAWPRVEVVDNDGYDIPSDIVPQNVVFAQCYLAGIIYSGTDVQPILERGGRIQSESVGSLSTSYFEDAAGRDVFTTITDLLGGLANGLGGQQGNKSGVSVSKVALA